MPVDTPARPCSRFIGGASRSLSARLSTSATLSTRIPKDSPHRHAIAKFAHQGFGRVSQCFQSRQTEKAAGAFDRVHKAKNIAEDLAVVRFLLQTHEL